MFRFAILCLISFVFISDTFAFDRPKSSTFEIGFHLPHEFSSEQYLFKNTPRTSLHHWRLQNDFYLQYGTSKESVAFRESFVNLFFVTGIAILMGSQTYKTLYQRKTFENSNLHRKSIIPFIQSSYKGKIIAGIQGRF